MEKWCRTPTGMQRGAGRQDPAPASTTSSKVRSPVRGALIAQGKGVVIPDEAKENSSAMSAWIDSNRSTKRHARVNCAFSLAKGAMLYG